ncbi:MAG: hypothetical protein ACHP7N_04780 [Caulobacterales bacterium]
MKHLAVFAAVGLMLMAAGTAAAQGARQIVRGVVASVTESQLVVTGKDGKPVTVMLAPNWTVAVMKPITADAIQTGSFIGTTEMPQADGTGVSVEVHVFPPGVKMGEGHYPWDLQPGAMMTNGTVGTVTAVTSGRAIDVSYPNGTRHIVVPPNAPIVLITLGGDHSLIKPGASVFLVAAAGADGMLATNSISTGENGAAPPM